jgi:hypothetical protein
MQIRLVSQVHFILRSRKTHIFYMLHVHEINCSFILFLCIDIRVVFENVKYIILNLAFKLNEYANASLWLYIGDSNSLSMLL